MIFQQTEKLETTIDSLDSILLHAESINKNSDFELDHYTIGETEYVSIAHKDSEKRFGRPRVTIKLPHLKAVLKKEKTTKYFSIEVIHSYVDLIGAGLIGLTLIVLFIVFYQKMNSSMITSFALLLPILGLGVFMRLDKLKSELTELKQIINSIEQESKPN